MTPDVKIAEEIMRLRLSMMMINEKIKNNEFKIPIHLALGHESIAVAVSHIMAEEDQLVLPHRNIHYNLALISSLKPIICEFLLQEEGVGGARLGSMNLANDNERIIYTSSILGNNLSVAVGLALGKKVKGAGGCVVVVTGDGAIEEGAFFESLEFLRYLNLRAIVIVENNGWSLATPVYERRGPIDLCCLAAALDVGFMRLEGNEPFNYIRALADARAGVIDDEKPLIVEVKVETLGDWRLKTDEYPEGKFVNYHAGYAPTIELSQWPLIRDNEGDPVYVLLKLFEQDVLRKIARDMLGHIEEEIR